MRNIGHWGGNDPPSPSFAAVGLKRGVAMFFLREFFCGFMTLR